MQLHKTEMLKRKKEHNQKNTTLDYQKMSKIKEHYFKKNTYKKGDKDYKPAPGDAGAKTKPSKHTKKFMQMFG